MIHNDDLLQNAERLRQSFAEQAEAMETARRIPADVSSAMAKAGFYRMFVPKEFGGLETPPAIASRVFEALARGNASCAWVSFIGATSGSALARIEDTQAREIFATPETMIAGVFAPNGKAERVADGFQVSGRWQWGSGTQNADWILGGCRLTDNGEPLKTRSGAPRTHMMLFRADQVEFLDTWHVTGLKGTGSTDFQVQDVFVPESCAVGYQVRENPTAPIFQFPNFTLLALGIAAVALGIARSAIDELVQVAQDKVRAGGTNTLADRTYSHLEVARAEAALRSARAFYYEAIEGAWAYAERGDPVPVDARRDLRLATNNAVQSSVAAVDAMYTLAGGTSVYLTSALQRHFRDVHVATQHIMVGPNVMELVGRLYMGVSANTATL